MCSTRRTRERLGTAYRSPGVAAVAAGVVAAAEVADAAEAADAA
jgi:hypothetical protein